MVSFLTHFSIFNGITYDTCIHLSSDVIQWISAAENLTVNGQIAILKFKERLCFPGARNDEEVQAICRSVETELKTKGLVATLGMLIASGLESRCSVELLTSIQRHKDCTMQQCASVLLRAGTDGEEETGSSIGNADFGVRCAIALAMVERNQFTPAHPLLRECVREQLALPRFKYSNVPLFPLATEFVRCSNILEKEAEGEAAARKVLSHLVESSASPTEVYSLEIALVDSLIGQSRYVEAAKTLQALASSELPSSSIIDIIDLRLSKVRRRLGKVDRSVFVNAPITLKTLPSNDDLHHAIKAEYLDERIATRSFIRQQRSKDVWESEIAEEAFADASEAILTAPRDLQDWRREFLHSRILDS